MNRVVPSGPAKAKAKAELRHSVTAAFRARVVRIQELTVATRLPLVFVPPDAAPDEPSVVVSVFWERQLPEKMETRFQTLRLFFRGAQWSIFVRLDASD